LTLELRATVPTRRPALHWYRLSASAIHLLLYVGSEFNILRKPAYVGAVDFVPRFEGKGNYRHEAQREPLPSLIDLRRIVTAVLALHRDVLIAF